MDSIRAPKIFFKTNKENLVNFIRGVIDGDGSISLKKPISISSGCNKFLEDMKILFLKLDLMTSSIVKDKTCYVLRLYTRDNIKLYDTFYETADYYYPRKRNLLKINTFKNY